MRKRTNKRDRITITVDTVMPQEPRDKSADESLGKDCENNKVRKLSSNKLLNGLPQLICKIVLIIIIIQSVTMLGVVLISSLNKGLIDTDIFTTLFSGDLLSMGIGIIAIAVSVWIGLNIYVSVSKDEVEHLRDDISKLQQLVANIDSMKTIVDKIEPGIKNLTNVLWENLLVKLNQNGDVCPVSSYVADRIKNKPFSNIEALYRVLHGEELNRKMTEAYWSNNWSECVEYANEMKSFYDEIRKKYCDLKDDFYSIADIIEVYLGCRYGDSLFYAQASVMRFAASMFVEEKMQDSIGEFELLANKYFEKNEMGDGIKARAKAYIYNRIGYAMDLINKSRMDRNMVVDPNDIAKSREYIDTAIKATKDGRLSIYLRNYGLTFQRESKFEKALEQYQKSIAVNHSDFKSYNNIAHVLLKMIERDEKIDRGGAELSKMGKALKNRIADIEEAILMCNQCMKISPSFEDAYYLRALAYLYLYLARGNDKDIKKLAEDDIDILNLMGLNRTAFDEVKNKYRIIIGERRYMKNGDFLC